MDLQTILIMNFKTDTYLEKHGMDSHSLPQGNIFITQAIGSAPYVQLYLNLG